MRQRTVMIAAFLILCPWLSAFADSRGTTVAVVPVVDDRSLPSTSVVAKAAVEEIEKTLGRYGIAIMDASKLRDSMGDRGSISTALETVNASHELFLGIDVIVFSSVSVGAPVMDHMSTTANLKVNLRAIDVGTGRVLGMASKEGMVLLGKTQDAQSVTADRIRDPASMAARDIHRIILLKTEDMPPRPYRVK